MSAAKAESQVNSTQEENNVTVAPVAPRKQDEQDQTSQPIREVEAIAAKTEEDDRTNQSPQSKAVVAKHEKAPSESSEDPLFAIDKKRVEYY